jgi:MFS family permease
MRAANGDLAWRMLTILGLGEFLGMTLWFSATAVTPAVVSDLHMSGAEAAWLTMAVQGGFVAGTLVSALLNLADLISPRWVFGCGCLIGALANAAITIVASPVEVIAFRFLTGASLALVYPPAMKIAASWFADRRGVALGILIGCLTVGKATPYLLAGFPGESWRTVMLTASWFGIAGGLLIVLWVRDGPYLAATAPFDPRAALRIFTRRAPRLATLGYLGHMWELYAMWSWVALYVTASLTARQIPDAARAGSLAAFVAIASGALGCVVAGLYADKTGKARVAAWAMMVSASCTALSALVFHAPQPVLYMFIAVWGFSVVADSAQFSAIVSETTASDHVGTALTVQTCLGFLLTMASIRAVSVVAGWIGWQWAFLVLTPGPMLGVLAMVRLMRPPSVAGSGLRT